LTSLQRDKHGINFKWRNILSAMLPVGDIEAKKKKSSGYHKLLEKDIIFLSFFHNYFFQFSLYTLSQQRFKGIISTIENGVDIPGKKVFITDTFLLYVSDV